MFATTCKPRVDETLDRLFRHMLQYNGTYPGLFNGLGAHVLFLAYYQQYTGNDYSDIMVEKVSLMLDALDDGDLNTSLTGGITGVAWLLDHLQTPFLDLQEVINVDASDLHPVICDSVLRDIAVAKDDPLHGYIGKATYLAGQPSSEERNHVLTAIVDDLEKRAVRFPGGHITWRSGINAQKTTNEFYDLGIAHGVSGILLCLIKLHTAGIEQERIAPLIHGGIAWLYAQQRPDGTFPSTIENGEPIGSGRLAWCYGDLCIARAFTAYGHAFDKAYLEHARNIALMAGTRDKAAGEIMHSDTDIDICLCHGTAGMTHIFQSLCHHFPGNDLQNTVNNWLEQTLEQIDKNLAGDTFYGQREMLNRTIGRELADNGLLYGYAGVGLALMSAMGDQRYNAWNELLLLS